MTQKSTYLCYNYRTMSARVAFRFGRESQISAVSCRLRRSGWDRKMSNVARGSGGVLLWPSVLSESSGFISTAYQLGSRWAKTSPRTIQSINGLAEGVIPSFYLVGPMSPEALYHRQVSGPQLFLPLYNFIFWRFEGAGNQISDQSSRIRQSGWDWLAPSDRISSESTG